MATAARAKSTEVVITPKIVTNYLKHALETVKVPRTGDLAAMNGLKLANATGGIRITIGDQKFLISVAVG